MLLKKNTLLNLMESFDEFENDINNDGERTEG